MFLQQNLKESHKKFWECKNREEAEQYLQKWSFWATHSSLEAVIEVAKTIKNHWDGILNYFESKITNGILESIDSMMVPLYPIDVLKYLNVSSSFKVHFDSVIPASLAGVFLHSTPLSSLYLNPPCPLQKLKCVQ